MEITYSTEILEFEQLGKPTKYYQGHMLRYKNWWYYQISWWMGSSDTECSRPKEASSKKDAHEKLWGIMNKKMDKGYVFQNVKET